MQKWRIWIEIVAVIVVAVVAFILGRVVPGNVLVPAGPQSQTASPDAQPASPTREDVPAGTVVPDTAATNLPPGVAAPQTVKPAGGSSSLYLRTFNVTVQNGELSPATIIAQVGDILTITFESKDKEYKFTQPDYSLSWTVPAGGSKTFQFQAVSSGKFIFYCPSCGGPASGPVGYITAVPK